MSSNGANSMSARYATFENDETVSIEDPTRQGYLIFEAKYTCNLTDGADLEGVFCPRTFDDVMCWNATPAGTVAKQRCADYINKFNKLQYATRQCMEDGTWYARPGTNKSWTNYTACMSPADRISLMAEHMDRIQVITKVGYSLTLGSLIVAVLLMMICRRLKCKSNTLHINLFLAFMLRSFMSLLQDSLIVDGLGLQKDVRYDVDGHVVFIQEGVHWECKLLFTIFHYSIGASYMWIFMEGLYLHMLIYRTLYTERKGVRFYIILGWGLPFVFVVPWVLVRATLNDTLCWNVHLEVPEFYWIIKGPIIATIAINFVFFLDIIRVLCLRVKATEHRTRRKFRKIAKFTMVLIPLFGVLYIITILLDVGSTRKTPTERDLIQLYFEMFYNSFQGFLLSLLFCFFNEEVHNEIRRVWKRHRFRHGDSMITRSMKMTSFRKHSLKMTQASVDQESAPRYPHTYKSNSNREEKFAAKMLPLITLQTTRSLSSDSEHDGLYRTTAIQDNDSQFL